MQNTIKFFKDKKNQAPMARLNGVTYKGYLVGELPSKFAFMYDKDQDKEGVIEWFNHEGLTYIEKSNNPWA